MKVLCNKTHLEFKNGQFDLDDPDTKSLLVDLTGQLEKMLRIKIHNEIADLNFTENRKQVVKNGIENTALTVQDICAKVALGKANDKS